MGYFCGSFWKLARLSFPPERTWLPGLQKSSTIQMKFWGSLKFTDKLQLTSVRGREWDSDFFQVYFLPALRARAWIWLCQTSCFESLLGMLRVTAEAECRPVTIHSWEDSDSAQVKQPCLHAGKWTHLLRSLPGFLERKSCSEALMFGTV